MSLIQLTYNNFDEVIESGNLFDTTEDGNNLTQLVNKWNKYIEDRTSINKRLKIRSIQLNPAIIDSKFVNIDIGNLLLSPGVIKLYLYFYNSNVGLLSFKDTQNTLMEKVIQGDANSSITKLEFDNIHFTNENENSLIIANIHVKNFYFVRTINLSEKIQILGCTIDNLVISASDLGRMIFIENQIRNFYTTASVFF